MLLAALVVGLLTAYYFGVRHGIWAAGATAGLFFVAAVVPPLKLLAYGLVAAGIVAIYAVGPGRGPSPSSRMAVNQARRLVRRFLNRR
jgi:hypothetical protein